MKHYSRSAFTLVELLIAIAILAIIAALSFPGLQAFRKRSRNIECIHNLKTLGMGIVFFCNDHNGRFPPTVEDKTPRPTFGNMVPDFGPSWAEYIVACYLDKNKIVLRCPSRPDTWSAKGYVGYYPDYGFNERLSPVNPLTGFREGVPLNSIKEPARLIILGDVARYSGKTPVGGFYRIYGATDLHPRHLESHVNVLYADQHIVTLQYDPNAPPASDAPLGSKAFIP